MLTDDLFTILNDACRDSVGLLSILGIILYPLMIV